MNSRFVKMFEVIDEISMGPFGSDIKVDNFVETGVPVLNGANLPKFKLLEEEFRYVTLEKAKSFKKSIAKKGDIVITHRGTLGQISYIPYNSRYDEYVISQSQFRVSLNREMVDPVYFVYYFHTSEGQKRLLANKCHVGVPALAQATTNFKLINFPLPDIKYQHKVSNVLISLDNKIEHNNKIISQLEILAKSFYDYWFLQFDFPDNNGKPYKTNGGKMIWNDELSKEIPIDWEVKKISDLLPVITGKQDANFATENGAYNFFTCGEEILKCNTYEFEGKAILVAGNGNFNIKIYEGKFNAYQRTYILIPKLENHYTVVYFAVKNRIASLSKGSRGSIVKFITKGDLENIKIPLPKDDNAYFFNHLNLYTKQIEQLIKVNQQLSELRDWLLPMLMNGQVKVN